MPRDWLMALAACFNCAAASSPTILEADNACAVLPAAWRFEERGLGE